ncbi:hypothetical protein BU26DRAFT_520675 [Trematosphaeria pertusa]|uniref:Tim17-domain-containing protein n=1 Tax=Trematosphaeria pertusa TaxID=390896 RepID=A0A6A6IBH3_9PLEO|nr:uncharacterized protein BU26DRAFT_520675 [Trematosphaeria pertusa]KAF2247557.1 hypothetical protein BU26DRAFT_520675 [Trematosphaeria pertusa]
MATPTIDLPPDPPSNEPTDAPPSPAPQPAHNPHRLGMPFDRRLLLAAFTSFTVGTTLGYTTTARLAALRFRAENAHRLPVSNPGWYLYHKSKNYYKLQQGIPAGLRSGAYLAAWSGVFFVLEESLDVFRGTWRAGRTLAEMEGVDELDLRRVDRGVEGSRDFWSSAVAGMVTGGLWSVWSGFPMVTAARTIRLGLLAGLGYGVAQDGLVWVRGRMGGYGEGEESWVNKGARNRKNEESRMDAEE